MTKKNTFRGLQFWGQTFALFFLLVSAAFSATTGQDSLEKMLSNEKIRTPYIDEYLTSLQVNKDADPAFVQSLGWLWNSREELDELGSLFEKKFQDPTEASRIRVRLDLREYEHKKHGKGLLLLGILYLDDAARQPLALFGRSFRKSPKDGELEVWGDGLRIDHGVAETKKVISPILKYLDFIYTQLNAKRERLVADWRGRFYWTMADYHFDPEYHFWVGEEPKSQIETVRQNFANFLESHNIPVQELEPLKKLEDYQSPRDFVKAKHPTKKIALRTLLDVGTFQDPKDPMDVGMAFTLSDYTPQYGAPFIRSCSKLLQYNSVAMPAWRALRVLR